MDAVSGSASAATGPTMYQGQFMLKSSTPWAQSRVIKHRHFCIEAGQLKLYGRRGRTYKGSVALNTVVALRPTMDTTAPAHAIELEADSGRGTAALAAASAAYAATAAAASAAAKAAGIGVAASNDSAAAAPTPAPRPPEGEESAADAAERRRASRAADRVAAAAAAASGGGSVVGAFGSYLCTFVIAAEPADAEAFLLALKEAVPPSAMSEMALKARVHKWTSLGLQPSDYVFGKTIGSGTFGKVKVATVPGGRQVAVKLVSRSKLIGHKSQLGRLTQEICILKCLRHPHVIGLEEVHHLPGHIWMVMELVRGGDLLSLLNERKRLTEREVQHIFGQVVSAVAFCHSLGVAHRDLKLENILVDVLPAHPPPAGEPAPSAAAAAQHAGAAAPGAVPAAAAAASCAPAAGSAAGAPSAPGAQPPASADPAATSSTRDAFREAGAEGGAAADGTASERTAAAAAPPSEGADGPPAPAAPAPSTAPPAPASATPPPPTVKASRSEGEAPATKAPGAQAGSAAAGRREGGGADGGSGVRYVVKVADFGLCTLMPAGEFLRTQCGSPHYVAPELLSFDSSTSYDGCEADAWSLGVILHVLLTSRLPFEGDNSAQLYARIRGGLQRIPPRVPPLAARLLSQILVVQPARRLTVAQMAAHPWLAQPDGQLAAAHSGGGSLGECGGALEPGGAHSHSFSSALRRPASMPVEVAGAARADARPNAAAAAMRAAGQDPLALALITTLSASPPMSAPGREPHLGVRRNSGNNAQPTMRGLVAPAGRYAAAHGAGRGSYAQPQHAPARPLRPARVLLSRTVDALIDVDNNTLVRVVGGARPYSQYAHVP